MIENPTGIFVNADLRLEILVQGKGLGFTLTPALARDLARVLLDRAHASEQRAGAQATEVARAGSGLLVSPN